MNRKARILTALAAMTMAMTTTSPAMAGEPVSPAVCKLIIQAGMARYEEAWASEWKKGDFAEIWEAFDAFVDHLSESERELIREFEAGNVPLKSFRTTIGRKGVTKVYPEHKDGRDLHLEGHVVSEKGIWWVQVTTSIEDENGNLKPVNQVMPNFTGEPLNRLTVAHFMHRELSRRTSQALGLPPGPVATNAVDYALDHQQLPESCKPKKTASVNTEADEALAALEESEMPVESSPASGADAAI